METIQSEPVTKDKNSAQDFFLYLLVFLSLGFVSFGAGNILFQMINKFVGDLDKSLPASFFQSSVKFGIAALFIASPIFFFVSRVINKRISSGIISLDSSVRRWLTYVILFFAASTIIGDLIALIMNFLEGDYTFSFLLKISVILLIAGSIFGYYFWDMRRKDLESIIIKNSAVATFLAVLIIFISAFFLIDSPKVAREKKIDEQALIALQSIDSSVRNYFQQSGKLPEKTNDLKGTGFEVNLKEDALVKYKKIDEKTYSLCASFLVSNMNDTYQQYAYPDAKEWKHETGNVCFDRIALIKDEIPVPIK
jgi:hypothetical protein